MSELSATERYLQTLAEHPPELTKLTLPSGFEIEMEKPQVLGFILNGELPGIETNKAVENWSNKGLLKAEKPQQDDEDANLKGMLKLRDKVVAKSHNPKLVLGEATKKNEISVLALSDEDLTFLMFWVGGGSGNSLSTFSFRPEQSARTGVNAKRNRRPRK